MYVILDYYNFSVLHEFRGKKATLYQFCHYLYHFLVVNLDGNNEIWKCHSMRDYGVTDIHLKKEKLTNMNQYADLSKKRNIE